MTAARVVAAALLALAAGPVAAVGCTVQPSGLSFGGYDPFSPIPLDSMATVVVNCNGTPGALVAYTLRLGTGGSGSYTARRMRGNGAWSLDYNLYVNPARSLVWGDGNGGSQAVGDAFLLPPRPITRVHAIHGRLFQRQNVPPGPYADTLVLTLEF
ncbi:MAG: hypothetical protein RJA99_3534 [Pseudomonadota bacterium]|jgi:spore coat protein U-like protein